ncbi:glycine--tRNA ligase [Winogradskya consettensis]|uniref:Multifunctional fusion protein n=1 Tax=Winogradskya consettensis TaxID=113560 RepID=A0A919SM42_9ACTN|nr:glycine--tRNA ligase [Actinoplanes consettensis]GIM75330.1 glycine--tRNA ligase [Actinoplanes consettensis]
MLTMQDALARLSEYWARQGCLTVQPMNTEVGAGTWNSATFLRSLGPEPWRVAYVEPSVRPDDSRYGNNPNRLQTHTQFQVVLKPEPGNAQELYLDSLTALGIDVAAHDVRFVEDNWTSPALGMWGLGWEVWLDGLEITQFTYFQQAGGLPLDESAVEITYGVERIVMALQGVTDFKDIEYAPGVRYGEMIGQAEYEMSRYYLDDADIAANRSLLELYSAEADRMLDLGLPVPAHTYLLKCSHAFNVLDARGAVSTADRAAEFGRMRRLSRRIAELWISRRDELGHPLGLAPAVPPAQPAPAVQTEQSASRLLVLEVGCEELPPGEALHAAEGLGKEVRSRLDATRLAHGAVQVLATPRRLIVLVDEVAPREEDFTRSVKGPKVAAAFDAAGEPTGAVKGFARSQGVDVAGLGRMDIDGVTYVAVTREVQGRSALEVLAEVTGAAVATLRSAKNMRWNDPALTFSRPIRWLTALWGSDVVPTVASGLAAGRDTRLHRTAEQSVVAVATAEEYLSVLAAGGIVADPAERRRTIVAECVRLAAEAGGRIDVERESRLIDQITFLVEQPVALLGTFAERYLELPSAVLTTVMRKHQRYLPVLDADGQQLPFFITVANGDIDVDLVRAGNERVLRARYEDAAFFYRADLALPLPEMRDRLEKLTFTEELGSMGDRARRVGTLGVRLAEQVELTAEQRKDLEQAAALVKFDQGSQLVTELTSLAGVMAEDYARHGGASPAVATAVGEAEMPRASGAALPGSTIGALLSVADRLDLIVGLAATAGLPTGSSDPFAVRRAVLGALSVLRQHPTLAVLDLRAALALAADQQPVGVRPGLLDEVLEFFVRRYEQTLAEAGTPADLARAVAVRADRPWLADQTLKQLTAAVEDESFQQLAAAIGRCSRIVPAGHPSDYDPAALVEPVELRLHEVFTEVRSELGRGADLAEFRRVTGDLVPVVNAFFDEVFVMAEDPAVRAARLGLLASIRDLGTTVLDWSQLRG